MSTPKWNINNDNAHNSFQMTSLVLTKDYGYLNWKFDLSVWEAFTLLEKEKQGLLTFLSLTSLDKQAVEENFRK